jgi:hypothetical protein
LFKAPFKAYSCSKGTLETAELSGRLKKANGKRVTVSLFSIETGSVLCR